MTEDEIVGSMDIGLSNLRELLMDREAWCPWGCKELETIERLI